MHKESCESYEQNQRCWRKMLMYIYLLYIHIYIHIYVYGSFDLIWPLVIQKLCHTVVKILSIFNSDFHISLKLLSAAINMAVACPLVGDCRFTTSNKWFMSKKGTKAIFWERHVAPNNNFVALMHACIMH